MHSGKTHLLNIPALSHDAANVLASRIDEDVHLDALAVIINETDEGRALWDVVAYFASEEEALLAAGHLRLPGSAVSPLVELDWVRQSLEGLSPVIAGRFFLFGSHDRQRRRAGFPLRSMPERPLAPATMARPRAACWPSTTF